MVVEVSLQSCIRVVLIYLVLALGVGLAKRTDAQGYEPGIAASKMTVPDGLAVNLFASEPMVRQPVCIEFDDRGRMWVVQYLQYPNPEGLERVSVDRYSRTQYDRMPEPPPHGPKGNDRITILIDRDRDGVAEDSKDFVSDLNLASGIAFGHEGVFVLQTPYLLFYPDRDRDDVPDSDPEVCLTGFGMQDAHSVANSLTWGPDGWLYGNQGSTVTANIRGIEFQQGIWRYHPVTKEFELFSEGGGNMWGLDFDPDGQVLACTNLGPYILIHGMQGAYYWKSFGKHGDLHNPYTYGYFDHMPHHNPTGGHVAVGGQLYQGGSLPEAYHGKFIAANLLSHTVYWHSITANGATFESHHEGTLLDSNDTWFAPSDMTTGPDGAIYICDWHDARMAHPDPDADWDRRNGRIYRIAASDTKVSPGFDLRLYNNKALLKLLDSDNAWFARRARVLLSTRDTSDIAPELEAMSVQTEDRQLALESLWTRYTTGNLDTDALIDLLHHPDYAFRLWAVRLLGDHGSPNGEGAAALAASARREGDVGTKAQLAATAQRTKGKAAIDIIAGLLETSQTTDDLYLPLLAWWAVERHAQAAATHQDALLAHRGALTDQFLLPRLARRLVAQGDPTWDDHCAQLLAADHDEAQFEALLESFRLGLADRAGGGGSTMRGSLFEEYSEATTKSASEAKEVAPLSPALQEFIVARWEASQENPELLVLATQLEHRPALDLALKKARDRDSADSLRQELLDTIARVVGKSAGPELLTIALSDPSLPVQKAALEALRRFDAPKIGEQLAKAYPSLPAGVQTTARQVLLSRATWTGSFFGQVEAGHVAPDDVPVFELRRVAQYEDEALDELVKKHWGDISGGTPEALLAEMRRLNNDLNAGSGDPVKGKEVFTNVCAQCHEFFGEGFNVGPELTQSNRMDRAYLLASLVNPNLVVRKEYMQYLVETKDGGFYNGIITERSPGSITLMNAKEVKTTVATGDVDEIREAGISLMPEGILAPLTPDDVRNLFAYLQSEAPAHGAN